jgi:hypothetical protein
MKRLLLAAVLLLSCARVGRVNLNGENATARWHCNLFKDELTCTALLLTHQVEFADDSDKAEVGWVCVRNGSETALKCIDLNLFILMAQQRQQGQPGPKEL